MSDDDKLTTLAELFTPGAKVHKLDTADFSALEEIVEEERDRRRPDQSQEFATWFYEGKLDSFTVALPTYRGWRAYWEHPGYISWSHPQRPKFAVHATPDWSTPGEVSIEAMKNVETGTYADLSGVVVNPRWPLSQRRDPTGCVSQYMAIVQPVLDRFMPPAPSFARSIFDNVLEAMQDAEEAGGPEPYDYVVLMQKIAAEATKRANACLEMHTARANLSVLMRPPREGERGWWVEARTPAKALAEVLQESEELGWIAERDYDSTPDENNMIAITVVVGGES